ncbi:MAG: FtsX-like permease family protein [Lachnospiraceae bacterium]|nr:FtsX-like permease family protein [Lachnospiraceae bacterium]MDD3796920.1 FtsX-like permease family protein [Lachnospiraceae bacterium]
MNKKKGLYFRLAWTGICKNKRLYVPYLLTCMGMVMMFYIETALSSSTMLRSISGGDTMQQMLTLGCGVIGVFSLVFLFYTNSFLIRRRKKEFGLYNILGMGKRNLARILLWESLITAGISLLGGLAGGILFYKFGELGMVNILKGKITFSLTLQPKTVLQTICLFAVIFVLILLNTMRQVHLSNPIELLHGENTGEKPPRANWFLAVIGALLLGGAYYLAVTIEDPVAAMMWFFVAVVMVILATYLLFIAGSVTICRMLQKRKKYYYKTNHFVSISSMVYRMKRNGAGLASICILCTMVLVMLSTTVCLFIGTEDSLRSRYPRNLNLDLYFTGADGMAQDRLEEIRQTAAGQAEDCRLTQENVLDYRAATMTGYLAGGRIETEDSRQEDLLSEGLSQMRQIFIVPLEDYNRLMNQSETLETGEALVYSTKTEFTEDTIIFPGEDRSFQVKKIVPDFVDNGTDAMQVIPSLFLFIPDFDEFIVSYGKVKDSAGESLLAYHWLYGFDLDGTDEQQIQLQNQLEEKLNRDFYEEKSIFWIRIEGAAKERAGFYGLYGGLFFLGILLGIVFIFAAVLIIYYKQISEGYEDQSRFEIMQKVGMTKQNIRKSVNSQVLTVFFLPLITAGVHLMFAFPMLHKLLELFAMMNSRLLILVTVLCFLIFTLFYVLVYRITSGAYYSIVSGAREE